MSERKEEQIIESLPITTGNPQPCPMPECGGETEMAFYANRNVFWIRCKTHPLWHFGPHRETEAEALAAWNESLDRAGNDARILKLLLSDTELLLDLERKDTAYLKGKLEVAELHAGGSVVALTLVRNRLTSLRREAGNDDMPELQEELSGVLSIIDAAMQAATQETK